MTTFTFVHALFNGPSEHVPAMNEVKDLIEEQQFSANVFALSGEYANWETDEVCVEGLAFCFSHNTTILSRLVP